MFNLNGSCQTCHNISEDRLRARIAEIQDSTASSLRQAEAAVLALVDDIKKAKAALGEQDGTDQLLASARKAHRRASMRWDFIASENSTGFHSPQESGRVLAQAIDIARRGQLELQNQLAKQGVKIEPTIAAGTVPEPGEVIADHHPPVGSVPPKQLGAFDKSITAVF